MENREVENKSRNKKVYFWGGVGILIVALLCLPKKNHIQVNNINIANLNIGSFEGRK